MITKRLYFSIDIKAEPKAIWKSLWDDHTYRQWATVFFEGSYIVAKNWKEGNKVLFLSKDQSGIYSKIVKHVPNKIIEFRHIGKVLNGKEQALDEETKKWTGATEIYRLTEVKNYYTLSIELDVMDEHLEFMKEKMPVALEKIKSLSLNVKAEG